MITRSQNLHTEMAAANGGAAERSVGHADEMVEAPADFYARIARM